MEDDTGQDIAVYVVGAEPADILSDFYLTRDGGVKGRTSMELAYTIRNSSDYSAANHTRKILEFAGKERKKREEQRIDDVDSEQIRQSSAYVGAKYLCIAEFINTGDSTYSLEARLVDAATAEIIKNVSVPLELIRKASSKKWGNDSKNESSLKHAAQHAARELMGGNNEIVNYTMKEVSDKPDRAIVELTDAIRLEPNEAKHHKYRGYAYKHVRDYACAAVDYTEAIRLEPDSAEYRYDMGRLYLDRSGQFMFSSRKKRDIDSAVMDYTDAIRLAPDRADYRAARAEAYSKRNSLDTTVVFGRMWSDSAIANYTKTMRENDLDSAIADYTEAIWLTPDATRFLAARAELYSRKNDLDSAIADYTEIIRLKPISWHFSTRGDTYLNRKDHDSAIADYTEAIRLDSFHHHARYYANRGDAYLDRKDYDSAIADYTDAIRQSNASKDIYYAKRGDTYFDRKDFDMAIADYTDAIIQRHGSSFYDGYPSFYTGYGNDRGDRLERRYNEDYYHARRGDAYFAKDDYYNAYADYNIALKRGRSGLFSYSELDKNVKLQTEKNLELANEKLSFFSHVRYWLSKKKNKKMVLGSGMILILIGWGLLGRILSRPRS
jgi:tetratricopeptide (TPR) repeat protein